VTIKGLGNFYPVGEKVLSAQYRLTIDKMERLNAEENEGSLFIKSCPQ